MCGQSGSYAELTVWCTVCQVLMKSPNKILVKILHSVPVLSSLTVSQLQRLADVLTEVTVRSAASLRAAVGASALQSNAIQRNGSVR